MARIRILAIYYIPLTCAVVFLSEAPGATFPYTNDFSSVGFENTTDHPGFETFTLDAGNSELDFALPAGVAGGNRISTTSVELNDSALETSDFVISTRVTVHNSGYVGATQNTAIGFGSFSNTTDFATTAGSTYYLTDWFIHSNSAAGYGLVRIHAQGDNSGFTATNGDSDGSNVNGTSIVWGNTYELRLTGVYHGGALNLTLAVFDELGNQMGTSATATDTSPLTGDYFGYRNAVSTASTQLTLAYDYFNVTSPSQGITGDYNDDGTVDAADYVVWRKHLGTDFTLPNEDASPGEVDAADYGIWVENYGSGGSIGSAASAASAPEPNAYCLVMVASAFLWCLRRSRHMLNLLGNSECLA